MQEQWAVTVKNLRAMEIAAIWQARGQIGDCSGRPGRTLVGPAASAYFHAMDGGGGQGDWKFTGASYIILPKTVPPDGRTAMFLMAEGLLGLVWGGERWFSEQAKIRGIPGATRKGRRGIVSELEGTVYSGPPPRWRYPDSVTVDGIKYRSANTSALEYYSAEGKMLDVAAFGP